MANESNFPYDIAFSRNLGWLTPKEQELLRSIRVGIAGVGGVGGQYAELLARIGVTKFVLWDPDEFSVENTNRQNQCMQSTYGRKKVEVIKQLITDINPNADVTAYAKELAEEDLDSFCSSIDFYFDGLDFFATDIRIALFRALRRHNRPAVTVAPVGTGASAVLFTKDSMTFDDYFGLHTVNNDHVKRSIYFLTGLTPTMMQGKYLVDASYTNLQVRKVPSMGIGVYTAASLATTIFLKVVLNRGRIQLAPWAIHFDPYLFKFKCKYTAWGYRNPIQIIKRWVAAKLVGARLKSE